jgi:hypothetical protein
VFCERGRCDASRADRFAVPQRTETVAQVAPRTEPAARARKSLGA